MKRYNPKELEPRWESFWDENRTYQADLKSNKTKYIAMSMFNYPSGAGIHIGHAMNYTISDVLARFKRQQGYESYHPVGWDAFGLPAENYAIKAGVSPQESMAKIIPSYHTQYKAMGWSNDWSKEISTHLPEYYKWTQWIFSEMYRSGLAYQDSRTQWWCTKCQTVLANEQVIDGKCWRHDGPDDPLVEKREVKQWFFKITEYADELLEAIDDLDWSESVKLAQKNWIGRSKGAEVDFDIDGINRHIKVFTTRPDTLFGATFIVVAPEHHLISELARDDQRESVEHYVSKAIKKTEVERQTSKEKTGVFTGSYAINPISKQKIPIWVADYVLAGYGTGAIMAVPAHDERDYEFALRNSLQITPVVVPQDIADMALRKSNDKTTGESTVEGKVLAYWAETGVEQAIEEYRNRLLGGKEAYSGEGVMINSGEYDGMLSGEAREIIVKDLSKAGVAEEKTQYKILDWSVSRQRYWGAPIPIIHCEKCGIVLVEDKDLPVILPVIDDFKPVGDGRSALARATEWLQVDCPKCGGKAERETDTLDTYICSSWYMLRYFDPENSKKIFDSDLVNKWTPIDFYNGADHATAHMIYARFITRFFHKKGLVSNPEPFKKFLFNGKVTAADGQMFSKSKGNGVDPLEIINNGYGADALRTYLMFAAPLDIWVRWDEHGVPGTHRFLSRIWTLIQEYGESPKTSEIDKNTEILRVVHKTIHKVTHDIEGLKYNTAISAMMACVNELYKFKAKDNYSSQAWQFALESLTQLVAPFAPHMAEELWHDLGNSDSIHRGHWPAWDDEYLQNDRIIIVVQINGKLRAQLEVDADISKSDAESLALRDENIKKYLGSKKPAKVIYVPGRLINIVI